MGGFNQISSQSMGTGLICELVLTKSAARAGPLNWFGGHFYLNRRLLYRHARIFPSVTLHTLFNQIGIKSIRFMIILNPYIHI